MAAREVQIDPQPVMMDSGSPLAAEVNMRAAHVKAAQAVGRSHKPKAAEKEREWQREKQRVMRSER
jgi:tmRNA-binding protein